MPETEPMIVKERRKYLHKMRIRYWQAESKSAKRALLAAMQSVTNLQRKSLIRLITLPPEEIGIYRSNTLLT